jgi:hypothetical protein
MKRCFDGDDWYSLGASGPAFKIAHAEQMIRSEAIIVPNRRVKIVLRGKFDSVLALQDSRLVVCDFKTTPVREEHLDKYWVQLHAYAYALEHAALGSLSIPKVDGLGLAVFDPSTFEHDANNGAALSGAMQWIDMPRDDNRFIALLDDVAAVLEDPQSPRAADTCQYCRFREAA